MLIFTKSLYSQNYLVILQSHIITMLLGDMEKAIFIYTFFDV